MTRANKLITTAMQQDTSTGAGRRVVRLLRGQYSKLFAAMSCDVYESAMRVFDYRVRNVSK